MQRSWIPAVHPTRERDAPQGDIDALYASLRMGLTLIGLAQTSDDRHSARRACRKARDLLAEAIRLQAEVSSDGVTAPRVQNGIDNLKRAIRHLEADVFPAPTPASNQHSTENRAPHSAGVFKGRKCESPR